MMAGSSILRRRSRMTKIVCVNWQKFISISILAATAMALIIAWIVPYSSIALFIYSSVPLFYTVDQSDAVAAMPLPSPLPPPPPPSQTAFAAPVQNYSSSSFHRPRGSANSSAVVGIRIERSKSSRDSRPQSLVLSLPPDKALAYAKSEIERAPRISDDADLHAPLFRNISAFKRSYELMEQLLKVYVYRDGKRPIFHTPPLRGIYASEGWFMKLMEENKQFTVRDPNKAHLFYLAYSSRRLQEALYVPDSHNLRPLSFFLRDYVVWIASKYPFWNRTRGSDHFLVACHDWGPYETTAHDELRRNSIKALCNADTSEGIFVRGRDVSLPETSIRVPKRPLRNLGGKPVSQRFILAFFAGQMHGPVRPNLLKYWGEEKDPDMRVYGPLPPKVSRSMSYINHMKSSRFCLCPMGYEVNSPRIVEAIYYECVPVIIADNFVPPFDEVLDWSSFSVTVAERDIPQLKSSLQSISLRRYIFLQNNVKRLQKHFLWHAKPVKYDLFHMILHSVWFNRISQIKASSSGVHGAGRERHPSTEELTAGICLRPYNQEKWSQKHFLWHAKPVE